MPIIEATKENFDKETKTGLVLVDFNADWCGPCQMLRFELEELSLELEEKILSVNIDDSPELANEFDVSGIPCLVVLKDGKEVFRSVGAVSKRYVKKLLEKAKK